MDKIRPNEIKPLPRHTIGGAFNQHFAYEDADGKSLLRRRSLSNPNLEDIIRSNIEEWGYDKEGITLSVRSDKEMSDFSKRARDAGLRVLPMIPDGENGFLSPYLEHARTLDAYLPAAGDEDAHRTLEEIFDDVGRAHAAGITYGDRWPHNILVDPTHGVVNIDFDFKLDGPGKELDLAQLIFFTVALDTSRSPAILPALLRRLPTSYDFDLVRKFIGTRLEKPPKEYAHLRGVFDTVLRDL